MYDIAVAMTTYNAGNRVVSQLASIMQQTMIPDEIIICDDRSTDNTIELVREFAKEHDQIKWTIVVNEQNMGWKKNFAKAICMAESEVIFLADQDDFWHSRKIEKMSTVLERRPEIKALACKYYRIDDDTFINEKPLEADDESWKNNLEGYINTHVHQIKFNEFFYMTHFPGCCLAIRKEYASWFQTEYWNGEYPHDEFLLIVSQLLDSAYYVDEQLIFYLRHSDAVTYKKMNTRDKRISLLKEKKNAVYMANRIINNLVGIHDAQRKQMMISRQLGMLKKRIDYLENPSIGRAAALLANVRKYERLSYLLGDIKLSTQ